MLGKPEERAMIGERVGHPASARWTVRILGRRSLADRQRVRDLEGLVRTRAAKPKVAKPPVTQWKQDRDRARRRAR